jgi:hypothetical protein
VASLLVISAMIAAAVDITADWLDQAGNPLNLA